MPERMLTTGEAARMTGYCVRTVVKWFDTGLIAGYRVPGGQDRRINERSLRQMANRLGMPLTELPPKPKRTSCRRTKCATKP